MKERNSNISAGRKWGAELNGKGFELIFIPNSNLLNIVSLLKEGQPYPQKGITRKWKYETDQHISLSTMTMDPKSNVSTSESF